MSSPSPMSFPRSSWPILSGMRTEHRSGLTLIEVIVAMLVFAIGGLGLAAGSAVIVKQIGLNNLRSNALTIARSRIEQAIASGCGSLGSGQERKLGIRSVWTVTGGSAETLEQTLERQSTLGMHSDRFLSAIPCD